LEVAHYALICPDDAGHVLSVGPLGVELIRRGHRVTMVTGGRAVPIAEKLGLPLRELPERDIHHPLTVPTWLAFSLAGCGWMIRLRNWFRWRAQVALRLLPQALEELQVDGVIIDHTVVAASTVVERLGLPFITLCSATMWHEEPAIPPTFAHWSYAEDGRGDWRNRWAYAAWHWFQGPTLAAINRQRRAWQLPEFQRITDSFSSLAQISQLCREFDFPRRELPAVFHYIGSLTHDRQVSGEASFPWDWLNGRPLVFASLGSMAAGGDLPLLHSAMSACRELDVQLVMTLGKWRDRKSSMRERLGSVPDNVMVVDFAPQLAILDRADLFITHAGVNSVLEAICRAVPMVAVPSRGDTPAMGSRIERAGIGVRTTPRASAEQMRSLIQRVLEEKSFRRSAESLRDAMIAAGGVRRAAEIAEEALTTGRPVRRDDM
jgi:zeaxanthin glucosyltransferase